MKKAKIMLMVIAIVGVVGGALAFKTAKFQGKAFVCRTTTITNPVSYCIQPGVLVSAGGSQGTVYATTTINPGNASCTSPNGVTFCINSTLTSTVANAGE